MQMPALQYQSWVTCKGRFISELKGLRRFHSHRRQAAPGKVVQRQPNDIFQRVEWYLPVFPAQRRDEGHAVVETEGKTWG